MQQGRAKLLFSFDLSVKSESATRVAHSKRFAEEKTLRQWLWLLLVAFFRIRVALGRRLWGKLFPIRLLCR